MLKFTNKMLLIIILITFTPTFDCQQHSEKPILKMFEMISNSFVDLFREELELFENDEELQREWELLTKVKYSIMIH